jgi:copper chaperone
MTQFSVPDMNCKHCQATIEKALSAVPGSAPVRFDLERHLLTTEGPAPAAAIIAALAEVEYPATVLG